MRNISSLFLFLSFLSACTTIVNLPVEIGVHDMKFSKLAETWDEAVPLGNATVGSLVWQKGNNLRLSIDRSDLWDLRSSPEFQSKEFTFRWLYDQVMKNDYAPVQKKLDFPYNGYPGPSKIPGAGLEFPLDQLGEVKTVHLYQKQAVCEVTWKSGKRLRYFIHANKPVGIFIFEGTEEDFRPLLVPPAYHKEKEKEHKIEDQSRHSLFRLGYEQGIVEQVAENKSIYTQKGWGDFSYTVAVKWKRTGNQLIGVWSATSSLVDDKASDWVDQVMDESVAANYQSHCNWWNNFYARSSVSLPDQIIEKQYYNEIYKIGSIARENSYPISLQAVWTADNGQLPPWKGDFHHDLNTELSYWPFYTGNYLKEGYGYLNTLWNQREENKQYTKQFFGTDGLNVPGVSTLQGKPMGGWSQYAMGVTVSAWLSQHFYLHWKYSQDRDFLETRAYPYLKDVAIYLEQFTVLKDGVRSLPLSASPEFQDNRMEAWFKEMTNFDRALTHFAFRAASELATELGKKEEAAHWLKIESELPDYLLDGEGGLMIAPGFSYQASHRHFSHLLSIHPLGLLDLSNGEKETEMIKASLATLEKYGPDWWCGYSYSWFANLKARVFDGEGTVKALRTFAECFCLKNGFHVNGDQTKTGKSQYTYRPFTLEGNMAFAAGVQEMLLQSHTGVIRIFPAIPANWKEVSFSQLRAMGAFLVSAELKGGELLQANINSEKGGKLRLANTFGESYECVYNGKVIPCNQNVWEVETSPNKTCIIKKVKKRN